MLRTFFIIFPLISGCVAASPSEYSVIKTPSFPFAQHDLDEYAFSIAEQSGPVGEVEGLNKQGFVVGSYFLALHAAYQYIKDIVPDRLRKILFICFQEQEQLHCFC